MTSEDVNQIKKTQEELAKASHKLAEQVYKDAQAKQQQAQQGPKQQPPKEEKKGKDDVVDADYKVEDEDKGKEEKK